MPNGTWTSTTVSSSQVTGNTWSESTNWSGGVIADGAGSLAQLTNSVPSGHYVFLDSSRTIGSISISSQSYNYRNLYINSGSTLNFSMPGGTPSIQITAFNSFYVVGSGSISSSEGLNITGSSSSRTVFFNSTGNYNISGNIQISNVSLNTTQPNGLGLSNESKIITLLSGAIQFSGTYSAMSINYPLASLVVSGTSNLYNYVDNYPSTNTVNVNTTFASIVLNSGSSLSLYNISTYSSFNINSPISGSGNLYASPRDGVTFLENNSSNFSGDLFFSWGGTVKVSLLNNSGLSSPIGSGSNIYFGDGSSGSYIYSYKTQSPELKISNSTNNLSTNRNIILLGGTGFGATFNNNSNYNLTFDSSGLFYIGGAGDRTISFIGSENKDIVFSRKITDTFFNYYNTSSSFVGTNTELHNNKGGPTSVRLKGGNLYLNEINNTYSGSTIIHSGNLIASSFSAAARPNNTLVSSLGFGSNIILGGRLSSGAKLSKDDSNVIYTKYMLDTPHPNDVVLVHDGYQYFTTAGGTLYPPNDINFPDRGTNIPNADGYIIFPGVDGYIIDLSGFNLFDSLDTFTIYEGEGIDGPMLPKLFAYGSTFFKSSPGQTFTLRYFYNSSFFYNSFMYLPLLVTSYTSAESSTYNSGFYNIGSWGNINTNFNGLVGRIIYQIQSGSFDKMIYFYNIPGYSRTVTGYIISADHSITVYEGNGIGGNILYKMSGYGRYFNFTSAENQSFTIRVAGDSSVYIQNIYLSVNSYKNAIATESLSTKTITNGSTNFTSKSGFLKSHTNFGTSNYNGFGGYYTVTFSSLPGVSRTISGYIDIGSATMTIYRDSSLSNKFYTKTGSGQFSWTSAPGESFCLVLTTPNGVSFPGFNLDVFGSTPYARENYIYNPESGFGSLMSAGLSKNIIIQGFDNFSSEFNINSAEISYSQYSGFNGGFYIYGTPFYNNSRLSSSLPTTFSGSTNFISTPIKFSSSSSDYGFTIGKPIPNPFTKVIDHKASIVISKPQVSFNSNNSLTEPIMINSGGAISLRIDLSGVSSGIGTSNVIIMGDERDAYSSSNASISDNSGAVGEYSEAICYDSAVPWIKLGLGYVTGTTNTSLVSCILDTTSYSSNRDSRIVFNGISDIKRTIVGTLNTELNGDYFRIYDGNGINGTLLLESSGNTPISWTSSLGQTFTVRFTSNASSGTGSTLNVLGSTDGYVLSIPSTNDVTSTFTASSGHIILPTNTSSNWNGYISCPGTEGVIRRVSVDNFPMIYTSLIIYEGSDIYGKPICSNFNYDSAEAEGNSARFSWFSEPGQSFTIRIVNRIGSTYLSGITPISISSISPAILLNYPDQNLENDDVTDKNIVFQSGDGSTIKIQCRKDPYKYINSEPVKGPSLILSDEGCFSIMGPGSHNLELSSFTTQPSYSPSYPYSSQLSTYKSYGGNLIFNRLIDDTLNSNSDKTTVIIKDGVSQIKNINNLYTGDTYINNGGVVKFSSIKNSGVPSSLGLGSSIFINSSGQAYSSIEAGLILDTSDSIYIEPVNGFESLIVNSNGITFSQPNGYLISHASFGSTTTTNSGSVTLPGIPGARRVISGRINTSGNSYVSTSNKSRRGPGVAFADVSEIGGSLTFNSSLITASEGFKLNVCSFKESTPVIPELSFSTDRNIIVNIETNQESPYVNSNKIVIGNLSDSNLHFSNTGTFSINVNYDYTYYHSYAIVRFLNIGNGTLSFDRVIDDRTPNSDNLYTPYQIDVVGSNMTFAYDMHLSTGINVYGYSSLADNLDIVDGYNLFSGNIYLGKSSDYIAIDINAQGGYYYSSSSLLYIVSNHNTFSGNISSENLSSGAILTELVIDGDDNIIIGNINNLSSLTINGDRSNISGNATIVDIEIDGDYSSISGDIEFNNMSIYGNNSSITSSNISVGSNFLLFGNDNIINSIITSNNTYNPNINFYNNNSTIAGEIYYNYSAPYGDGYIDGFFINAYGILNSLNSDIYCNFTPTPGTIESYYNGWGPPNAIYVTGYNYYNPYRSSLSIGSTTLPNNIFYQIDDDSIINLGSVQRNTNVGMRMYNSILYGSGGFVGDIYSLDTTNNVLNDLGFYSKVYAKITGSSSLTIENKLSFNSLSIVTSDYTGNTNISSSGILDVSSNVDNSSPIANSNVINEGVIRTATEYYDTNTDSNINVAGKMFYKKLNLKADSALYIGSIQLTDSSTYEQSAQQNIL